MKRPIIKVTRVTAANRQVIAEAAWAMATQSHTFTYRDIAGAVHITIEQATLIVRAGEREGAVIIASPGAGNSHRQFAPVTDFVRSELTRLRSPEENLWTAMRRLRSFTPTDLSAHATTDTVDVGLEKASEYCRSLLAAAYLRVTRKADPASRREAIYSLARETGPRPPHEKRVRALIDPNTCEVHVIGDHQ